MTNPTPAQRGHKLTITETDNHTPEDPNYTFGVTCQVPGLCNGWVECFKPHKVGDSDASSGPYGCHTDDPWCDEDYYTFHGVEHEWRYEHGWTAPYGGCALADLGDWLDDAWEIARQHGAGTYEIDDDWDDENVYLSLVEAAQ